jgi:hypothetical protein
LAAVVGKRTLWLLAISICVCTGCGHKIWFTEPMRQSYELGTHASAPTLEASLDGAPKRASLAKLQFFTSERIVLEREVTSRDQALTRGRVLVRRGRFLERVVVRRGTPGIVVDSGPDWIAISFEAGTRLVFDLVTRDDDDMPGQEREPASFSGEELPSTYYQLRTQEQHDGSHVVAFDGKNYTAVDLTTQARLEVRRRTWTQRRSSRRVLRGRRTRE